MLLSRPCFYFSAQRVFVRHYGEGFRRHKSGIKLDEKQRTIDLYLSDVNTRKAITDASVTAIVRLPGGEKKEIALSGMKMGEEFSYMNSLDTAKKGDYIFRIKVLREIKELVFSFAFKRE